jgi:2-polyprenyl-3-methyl-5-hydroxy-6-metoxy-1,4-benzoquinol methylase
VRAFVKSGVDIYTCPTCGCIMGDLAFHHDQYESGAYYTLATRDKAEIEAEWGFRWRYLLDMIRRYADNPRVLDVGAGNGYFVWLARTERGWRADGLEISEAEAQFARETFNVEFLPTTLDALTDQYDVITSFNVLEHVTDPLGLLRSMNSHIRPGGHLLLTTPNPSCIHRRLRGLQKWGMVAPPHHINLFTRRALTEALEQTGFEVLEYQTLSTYIRRVRSFDTQSLLLRRAVFQALKAGNLGADHGVICRKIAKS